MENLKELQAEFNDISDFLIALGDEKRQSIIIELMATENVCKGLRVNDLTEVTGLSRPAVSHHLKVLRQAKLIEYRSEGTKNYYYLSHDLSSIKKLQNLLVNVNKVIEGSNRK
ncbi:ArsR/SmtB family transcription factor [Pediococcus claussenii]|uniref:Transcriptional regulator, ArsR family n=1 Tax=Pediococcus claussenii (strain ATCC BAA-344 / DSM 14800 / JCM 18046 / KCTC 3811 / LMG 21948 / P06) TaxID=701521 RepID=G8PAX5_PEDCP|nr:metalloregulator ArsR/SmtB family transcription factor [Pediococcus claussenii]AEV95843.1 Transcriptional regulator, ArsR family [Pediococcus claussenii ATCC BAA-344]ANZ69341.1 transcriptional regulator [Pediococcus claussenii]ANZ71161.1 transcriptional regulator [Pediococcus claussenii]KRN20450.1 hypothetical protein IV79_GL000505 [Pediococcus claussenii]